ncbi:testis-expressed protein 13D-like [Dipodomys spectabilis]|uniref:testis-expressed protein 13D-like n=1 Tax=Dipodomys spectabilis TaxID=105255 RepID=UPI001C5461DB|nr:testis-expressed protein 13D-like [Dipodomys spectabilis]
MALDFGDGNNGFRHTEVIQFINSEVIMNGGGPEFFVAFSSLSWKEVEDQLRLVVANPQMPLSLKRAYAWSSLALGVKASVRHCEQQERCVQQLQDQIDKHEVASWALISQVQKLREERNEVAAQLQFTQTALWQAMEECEALRNSLLHAEKSAQVNPLTQDTALRAQAEPCEAAMVHLNADQQSDVRAVGAVVGNGAIGVHDRQNLETQIPAPIPAIYMPGMLSSWTSVVPPFHPVAPQLVTPQPMVPQSIAAQPISSQLVIPQKITLQSTDAQPIAPQPVEPPLVAFQPVLPQLITPQPFEPHPIAPLPMEPHLISSQPMNPQPIAPQPMEPHLIAPQPGLTQPVLSHPIFMPYQLPLYPSLPVGVPFVQPHPPAAVMEAASGVVPLPMPPVHIHPHGPWNAEGFQREIVPLWDQRYNIQVQGLENFHGSLLQGHSKSQGKGGSEKPQGPHLRDSSYFNQAEHAERSQGMDRLRVSGPLYQEDQNRQGMIPLDNSSYSQSEGPKKAQGMASLEVSRSAIQEESVDIVQGMVGMKEP